MIFFKNALAFLISLALLLFFYYMIRIPLLPAISIAACSQLFASDNKVDRGRIVPVILITIIAVLLYTMNAIASITHYPGNGNILGIVFDFITAWACLGTGILNATFYMRKMTPIDHE